MARVYRARRPENRDQFFNVPGGLAADEGSTASVVVTSRRAFPTNTLIHFALAPLSGATPGVDYTVPTSPIVLPAGQTSVTLSVPILGDAVTDPGEQIRVDWGSVVAA